MNKIILAAAFGATMLTGTVSAQAPATAAPSPPHQGGMRGMGPGALLRADLNHDGIVTRDEAAREAEQRFAAIDADHNGTVDRDERHAAMEQRRAADGEDAGNAPGRHGAARDEHGDQDRGEHAGKAMTVEDARARALRMFDRFDTNRDGQVDRTEIEAARLLMRARMSVDDQ